ncbi:MAG: hypothetical protein HYY85_20260 [Deltaproteobacteria bacterium]|nr:hypothetical protein [Deltaproteobacteria bacterium]
MRRGMMALVAAMAVVLVVGLMGTWAVAQDDTLQGQVVSITITKCALKPGTCEGWVELREASGQVVKLFVDPNTRLTRAGKPIMISELGIGNFIRASGSRVSTVAPWWLGKTAELSN